MNAFALDEIDQDLDQARQRLLAFERSRSTGDCISRIKRSSPLHPVLILRAGAGFVAMGSLVGAVVALALPFIAPQTGDSLSRLDASLTVPLFVAGFAVCFCSLLIATAAHFMAVSLGRDSPLLPAEARTHQRLVSDVKQLEARKRTSTPPPARPRMAR